MQAFRRVQAFVLTLVMLASCASPSFAQSKRVIDAIEPDQMKAYLNDAATKSIETLADGTRVLRVEVPTPGEKNWSVLHHSPLSTTPIRKGDLLVYNIRMRVTGKYTNEGDVGVWTESAVPEIQGSVGERIHPTTEMRTFRRSTVSPADFDAGQLRVSVHLSSMAQVVEIESLTLESFPADTPAEALGLDGIVWEGSDAKAAWRAEAGERIERLRKADVVVSVIDSDGNPIAGADVKVNQKRHAWRFGTFVGGKMLEDNADGKRYREEVLKRYSYITLPAYLADWGWRSDDAREAYFKMADWAQANDMPARGHLLVYPGWTATPASWFTIPKPELVEKMNAHIRARSTHSPRGA